MEVPSIFLNKILTEAAKKNSVDLHLAVGSLPMMRVDGVLVSMESENIVTAELIGRIISTIVEQNEMEKFKEDKEIVLVKDLGGNFRFRINACFQKNQPSLSFHYISDKIKNLSDLELPKKIKEFVKQKSGLLIITGTYGSGKTATAASFIEELNASGKKHIITIEDPIETIFIGKKSIIEQRQIGRDVKNVAQGLDYCLSEDVDMVFIGNTREDLSSAAPSILELAAGNCLVILEMNMDTSIKAVEKVINLAGEKLTPEGARYSLADVLFGVVAQKLLPKYGGGMVMAHEILLANSAVKSLLREGKIYQLENVIQVSRGEGMISMDKCIEELVNEGKVNRQENL